MRKVIIPVFVCLFSFNISNAASLKIEKESIEVVTYDMSSLFKLIQKGDLNGVKSMIKSGENINKKSKGLTPLMFAARYNKVEIVKLLIKNGAKLKTRSSKDGVTALTIAKRSKALDVVKVLEKALKK